jgi:eukaryotic-like serine/threonine-protein kinase
LHLTGPFDADRLAFIGDAVPLAEEVGYNPGFGQSAFYASAQGTLIYYRSPGSAAPLLGRLFWMDRVGKTGGPLGVAGRSFRISPDGSQVAFDSIDSSNGDVWMYAIERNVRTRLTTDPASDAYPVWSPDGARLVFASDRGNERGETALYEAPSTGAAPERLVLRSEPDMRLVPRDWSSDGRWIVFEKSKAPGANPRDLWVLPLSGDRKPVPYLATPYDESQPALCPMVVGSPMCRMKAARMKLWSNRFPIPLGESGRFRQVLACPLDGSVTAGNSTISTGTAGWLPCLSRPMASSTLEDLPPSFRHRFRFQVGPQTSSSM